jgi:hypothetical protein
MATMRTVKTMKTMWLGLAAVSMLSAGAPLLAAEADGPGTGLVEVVLRATERYRDPAEAEAQGWASMNSCVSGPEEGAMGVHFLKGAILFDGKLDPQEPEALIYEIKRGRARLVGVEYIVIAEEWHKTNAAPPVILGQHTHLVGAPNRYGLKPFYELHVWAWKANSKGMFVDWNPAVSCAGFEPAETPAAAHEHGPR